MLIETSVENYLSIKNKVTLSLDSSSSKKLLNNLVETPKDERLLKSAVIYGANASGKSNIIKSVFFIWNMVKNSHLFNIDVKVPRVPFKLEEGCIDKPSKFEITFIHNKIKYKYGFSCDNDKFIEEYLYYWPRGRESKIFTRKNSTKFDFTTDKKQQELIQSQTNENVLYLSRATQLGYKGTREAYDFIVNNLVINYSPVWEEMTIKKIYEDSDLKDKIIEILQKADFGGIIDIKVVKDKRKVQGFEFKVGKKETLLNPLKPEEQEFYDFKFVHKTKSGKLIDFEFNEESNGTRRTLAMLGPIFEILENGKVAFIDEFELNLHSNITKFLIKLFNSKLNKKNAQLIFTTHDTTLLDNEIFRRDQIYICSKDKNNSSKLGSYIDYNLREDSDFERAYLNGRVGGLPFIDETIFD